MLDRCSRAPALAVNHLFIGQHRLVDRIPVHHGSFLVSQPFLEQFSEKPLLPAVIIGVAGRQLTRPVVTKAQALKLPTHVVDVLVGPFCGWHPVLDRRIFRRQAESIPAHRLQHIPALHALIARNYIPDGVIAHMPHMQTAAGVGEHGQAIVFFPGIVLQRTKGPLLGPLLLDFCLYLLRIVLLVHPNGLYHY